MNEGEQEQTSHVLPFPKLPSDVMDEILSRLPVKSLVRFRCVCKSWNTLFSDPHFQKLQLSRATEINNLSSLIIASAYKLYYIPDIDPYKKPKSIKLELPGESSSRWITIVGSCNGLVCFTDRMYSGDGEIYLWNPVTGECTELPYAPLNPIKLYIRHTVLGFGFNPIANEYKVVRIVYSYLTQNDWDTSVFQSEVSVYTLGTNSWRGFEGIRCKIDSTTMMANVTGASQVALVNGNLHWMATCYALSNASRIIISFDIGHEKFQEVMLPDIQDDSNFTLQVAALGGHLSLVCHYFNKEDFDIWVMKDYGVKQSWTKQFSIRQSDTVSVGHIPSLQLLGIWKNGKILLQMGTERIVLYDPINKTIRKVWIPDEPYAFESHTYVESLVSPGAEE